MKKKLDSVHGRPLEDTGDLGMAVADPGVGGDRNMGSRYVIKGGGSGNTYLQVRDVGEE